MLHWEVHDDRSKVLEVKLEVKCSLQPWWGIWGPGNVHVLFKLEIKNMTHVASNDLELLGVSIKHSDI